MLEVILEESKLVARNLGWEENFKEKRYRKVKTFYGDTTSAAYKHQNEEISFKVNVFYIAIDTLIQEINSRFEAMKSINEIFSFIWKFNSDSKDKGNS